VRKWSIAAAIALTIAAVLTSLLPFNRPAPRGTYTYGSGFTEPTRCVSPIVSAWRREPASGGWFGYAPLTSKPLAAAQPCRSPARKRLLVAGFLAGSALLLVLLRRRPTAGAPNSQPSLAT
jgi:hypothetical protein